MKAARLLNAVLPAGIYLPARNWAVRLIIWKDLIQSIQGAGARDKFWLWLSFLAAPVTAARALSEWRDPLLLRDIVADVPGIGRFALRARTDDLWHVTPSRERAVLACVTARLRPGDYFVDAGANIGFYTIAAARAVGSTGSVLAVEMMEETARILRHHIDLNSAKNVRVIEGALSISENEIIVASMPTGSFGQASISNIGQGENFEVISTTLDIILRNISSIRLLKMDIEGAELNALKGGTQILNRVDAIIFEHVHAADITEITSLLKSYNFRIQPLDGCNSLALRT